MSEYILEFLNFSVKDQDYEVLTNFNLKLQKGEIISIVGQDGSGKNSIIYGMIGDLPAEGLLLHKGHPLSFDLFELKTNKIEIINQKPKLIENMSIAENLFLDISFNKESYFFIVKEKQIKLF